MNGLYLRRRLVVLGMAAAGVAGLWHRSSNLVLAQSLEATPACEDGDGPTPAQTEGPYFTPNSPERSDLREPDMQGTPIVLTGLVLTRSCVPISGASVELWHANDSGEYDNEGFRLRGHQFTDETGVSRFATFVPGLYPGRTRHFHAKFQAPGKSVLTTQFYFPNEPGNESDRLFNPALLLQISGGAAASARFDVVLG